MEVIVAFSTNDGETFIDKHSGDARYFDLYKVSKTEIRFLKRVINPPKEEKLHADPEKARGIARLLRNDGVKVLVSKVFGPNIKRIRKNFVCIMMNTPVSKSLKTIQLNLPVIWKEWEAGEERKVLNFKL